MENNQQYTFEQMKQFILANITHYEDFEEYSKANNVYIEDFENYKESGFISEITCGTYNGATNKFVYWEINLDNLINTILQDIEECDYYQVLNDYTDVQTPLGYVKAYTEMYNVFTIGEQVFVDTDYIN